MRGTKYLTFVAGLILASPTLALAGTDGPARRTVRPGQSQSRAGQDQASYKCEIFRAAHVSSQTEPTIDL